MAKSRILLAITLATLLASGADAQSLKDRLKQGADIVKDGANVAQKGVVTVGKKVEESVDSTVDLMTNEATPQETRDELDTMASETLARLFAEQPGSAELFDQSAGYAVFDTRKMTLVGVAAGAGRGVAVSRNTQLPVYMSMGTAGVGFSFGLGGFETKVVILFENQPYFEEFITNGYDATAEAGTMLGDDKANLGVRWTDGRAVFYLTDQGWKVSASVGGTRYWPDPNLN